MRPPHTTARPSALLLVLRTPMKCSNIMVGLYECEESFSKDVVCCEETCFGPTTHCPRAIVFLVVTRGRGGELLRLDALQLLHGQTALVELVELLLTALFFFPGMSVSLLLLLWELLVAFGP